MATKRGRKQIDSKPRATVGVSFNPDLLEKLDKWVADTNKNMRGITGLTRSRVLNSLVEDFINEQEGKE